MNSNFACKGTTNIWNTQGFNEENANLFVVLFVKCLLFAQTCERIFEVERLLASRVGVLEGTTNIWNTQGFFHYSLKKFAYIIFLLYLCKHEAKKPHRIVAGGKYEESVRRASARSPHSAHIEILIVENQYRWHRQRKKAVTYTTPKYL